MFSKTFIDFFMKHHIEKKYRAKKINVSKNDITRTEYAGHDR